MLHPTVKLQAAWLNANESVIIPNSRPTHRNVIIIDSALGLLVPNLQVWTIGTMIDTDCTFSDQKWITSFHR